MGGGLTDRKWRVRRRTCVAGAIAYLAGCGTCIALYLRDVTTSRRLCAAVTSGEATRAAVPPPGQMENVTRQAANPLVVLAILHAVTGALVVPVFGGLVGSLGGFALQMTLVIRFPGSATVAGAQLGDRADYSAGVEQALDLGLWVFSAGMVLGMLAIVAGLLMDGFGRHSERKGLRRALEDLAHPRPANALLARHAERRSSRLAQVCAGVAGVALTLGVGTLVVGYGGGLGSETFYAGYRRVATITVAVAVLLFVVALVENGWMNMRNGGLRNDLIRRWPTPPEVEPNQEGMVVRARVGAALRGSRMKKAR